jgi:hypothetical protein
VFRYARRTFAAWPGDLFGIASFLAFLARRRSWVFLRPSQICSRKRVSRRFRRSGPTCRLLAAHPTRLIFVGLTDRLVEKARIKRLIGRGRSLLRDVRLLGFAPVCDPCPAAPLDTVGPQDRSCLGLCLLQGCGRVSAHANRARPRLNHQPPGWRARVSLRAARPNPLMGLNACADDEPAHSPSLQRIDGADALSA